MIRGERLAVIRGERLVLRGVDVELDAGGALLLTGPNGAGKSSLIRVLAGLRRPDAGALDWGGVPIADDPVLHARRIAFLGPADALKPGLTARENLVFFARLAGRDAGAIEAALDAVGLAPMAAFPARHLSSGQKRRLAIARLLLARASLFLLDEPTTGLDAASVATLGGILARHRATGGMVVAATHLPIPLPGAATLALVPPAT